MNLSIVINFTERDLKEAIMLSRHVKCLDLGLPFSEENLEIIRRDENDFAIKITL